MPVMAPNVVFILAKRHQSECSAHLAGLWKGRLNPNSKRNSSCVKNLQNVQFLSSQVLENVVQKQWKLTRTKANYSMDINAWSLALWSLLALYSASSQLLLSVHLPPLDAPSVSSNTRCVIRTLRVRSLPVPTGDFIPSSQFRHTCASCHSAIVILMSGVGGCYRGAYRC